MSEAKFIKRAVIRDPAGLHVRCCGDKVRIAEAIEAELVYNESGSVCSSCGNIYDRRGWVIDQVTP